MIFCPSIARVWLLWMGWFLIEWTKFLLPSSIPAKWTNSNYWWSHYFTGGCKWIRMPAIVYSVHVATTLVPILSHIMFHEFPVTPRAGPQTLQERLLLLSIYAPYLLIPLMILFTMLLSSTYNSNSGNSSARSKKRKWCRSWICCDFSTWLNDWFCSSLFQIKKNKTFALLWNRWYLV